MTNRFRTLIVDPEDWRLHRLHTLSVTAKNPIAELCRNRIDADQVRANVVEEQRQKAKRKASTKSQLTILTALMDQHSLPVLSPEEMLWYDATTVNTLETAVCNQLQKELNWTFLKRGTELATFRDTVKDEHIPTTEFIEGVSRYWTVSMSQKSRIPKAKKYLKNQSTYCKLLATTLSDDENSRIYYLKCRSSFRSSSSVHYVFISLSQNPSSSNPHYLFCSCKTGLGTNCSHVIASLLMIQHKMKPTQYPLPINRYENIETNVLITGKIAGKRPRQTNIRPTFHRTRVEDRN